MPSERISKVLAVAGIASRRGADELVAAGRVTVDGRPAVLGERVDPDLQAVAVDGQPVLPEQRERIYLAVHKPTGVTSTVRDRHAGRTVLDLVPADLGRGARLYPVGRLDRDSEGLILLTDDGDWAEHVLHPRYGVEREYAIGLSRMLARDQAEALERGVELEEGSAAVSGLRAQTRAEDRLLAELVAPPAPGLVWVRATIHQGWKRQLRRMFAQVGVPVRRLVRVRVGTLRLGSLVSGDARALTPAEVRRLAPAEVRRPAPPGARRGRVSSG